MDPTFALLEAEALAVHLEDVNVMGEAVEQRAGQALGAEDAGPLVEGQIAGDDGRAALVALAEDLEPQLTAGHRGRDVIRLIDERRLVAGEPALQAGRFVPWAGLGLIALGMWVLSIRSTPAVSPQ